MNIQSILAFCSLLCIYAIRETTSASLEIVSYYINLSSLAILHVFFNLHLGKLKFSQTATHPHSKPDPN